MARQILGKVVPTGEDTYDNSRTYDELCIVMYNGQSYISKKETRGNKPDNTEYWQQLVEKPVKGADYFTEADKDEIVNDVTNNATNKYNQAVKTGIEKFDQNAERKTSDFNNNASEKTDTYNANADSATKTFTNNVNSKTEAYNTNATEKLDTYNSNHTAKLKEYNDNATSKLSAYNNNASNKVDAYNTNSETRLEEYNTNADNKIAEYDEHSKELNNKIVSTRNELERLKSNVLNTGEDTDTFIHLEDSAMAELQEIKVDGVLQQNTTTGKNKLNLEFSKESSTLAGMTFTHTKSEFTLNGTATGTWGIFTLKDNLPIVDGKTYSLSANIKGTNPKMQITLKASNGSNKLFSIPISNSNNYKNTVTANFTDEITKCEFIVESLTIGEVYNLTAEVQFEESSAPTDYEPYTGGQPSPSPDFPQEIKTITDGLKITSCGKNLLPNLFENSTKDGVTLTVDGDYVIINGTTTNAIYFDPPRKKWMMYYLDGNYTYTSNTYENIKYSFYADKDIQYIGSSTTPTTINFPKKIYNNIRPVISLAANSTYDNVRILLHFEKSSSSTLIESYIESQIQAKLPENEFIGKFDETYKDTLRAEYFPEEGQYHFMLDKKAGKHTFTGNEEWLMNYGNGMFHANNIFRTASELTRLGKCTHYIYNSANSSMFNTLSNNQFAIQYYNTSTNIFIKDLRYSSIDNFKNMLKTNNIEIYYILQTPYTLDLGPIDMPLSYKGITNIFTDSDLLPKITAKYYRTFEKTIQNAQINEKTLKQEITDLNTTVSALDNRLKALETKTVEEPTESEGTV